ncbi:uncharacterized protein LOC135821432 isoform X2 [Sycon ciliatum]|uniref:uncharacterized protein LOC135821432 isoform X2 n=1 Tax=Sycon ciliatum TaxID=27933 RepID=UPI0031F68B22
MASLFRDTFQAGPHLSLYEAKSSLKGADSKTRWHIDGPKRCTKLVWDSSLGSPVLQLGAKACKAQMTLTHSNGLGLRQSCLCVQVLFKEGDLFNMDLHLSDTAGKKHILYLSSSYRETAIRDHVVLHSKIGVFFKTPGSWTSLCIDLHDVVHQLFKTVDFFSLDYIAIHGYCCVKRVFTLKNCPSPIGAQMTGKEAGKPVIAFGSRVNKSPLKSPPTKPLHRMVSEIDTISTLSGINDQLVGEVTDTPAGCFGAGCSAENSVLNKQGVPHKASDVVLLNGMQPSPPAVLKSDGEIWASQPPNATGSSSSASRSRHGNKRSQRVLQPLGWIERDVPIPSEESDEDDPLFISGISLSQPEKVKSRGKQFTKPSSNKRHGRLIKSANRDLPEPQSQGSSASRLPAVEGRRVDFSGPGVIPVEAAAAAAPCTSGGRLPMPTGEQQSDEDSTTSTSSPQNNSSLKKFAFQFHGGPSVLNSKSQQLSQQLPSITSGRTNVKPSSNPRMNAQINQLYMDDSSDIELVGVVTGSGVSLDMDKGTDELGKHVIRTMDASERMKDYANMAFMHGASPTDVLPIGAQHDTHSEYAEEEGSSNRSRDTDIHSAAVATGIPLSSSDDNALHMHNHGGLIGLDGGYILPSFSRCQNRLDSSISDRSSLSSMSWMAASKSGMDGQPLSEADLESFNQMPAATPSNANDSVIIHAVNQDMPDYSRASSQDLPSLRSTMGSSMEYTLDFAVGKDLGESFGDDDRLHFGLQLQRPESKASCSGLWNEDMSDVSIAEDDDDDDDDDGDKEEQEEEEEEEEEDKFTTLEWIKPPLLDAQQDLDFNAEPAVSSPTKQTQETVYAVDRLLPPLRASLQWRSEFLPASSTSNHQL